MIRETSRINAQIPAVSQRSRRRPQTFSYLIVRLEMQYLHIVFHRAVTSAASDMPRKNTHETETKSQQSFKKAELQHLESH